MSKTSAFVRQKIPILLKLDQLQAKMTTFPPLLYNQIKKAIIAAGSKQPEGPFSKDLIQNSRLFLTNYYYFVIQSGLKPQRYWLCYLSNMDRAHCHPCCLFSDKNVSPGTS